MEAGLGRALLYIVGKVPVSLQCPSTQYQETMQLKRQHDASLEETNQR